MSTASIPTSGAPAWEITESRTADVGGVVVRRALPRRGRRTVGAWCFADHMGPTSGSRGLNIGPHPHIGLQTVTWLFEGEVLHRDSLGSEQPIRPGQLNLMTAGRGVSHAEETSSASAPPVHGMQLWVAQPSSTRDGDPAFEHQSELPAVELAGCRGTVLVGSLAGVRSPARADSDHFGADLVLEGETTVPVAIDHEHALVVASGRVRLGTSVVEPGHLAYLGRGRDELHLEVVAPARALLLGGSPFPEEVMMWWNYVARSTREITQAHRDWSTRSGRFGRVVSALAPIDVDPPPWDDEVTPGSRP